MSEGLIRGEYNTEAQGINIGTTMIVRDGYAYSWTSVAPNMGFKAKVVENVEANPNAGASGAYSWNVDQIGDYECNDWTADPSKFAVPTGVNFQEIK